MKAIEGAATPDLFGYDPGRAAGDVGFQMDARFNEAGDARLELIYTWDPTKRLAVWLMNNPSQAGKLDMGQRVSWDPTARRVVHFSRNLGCGRAAIVNWCPLVATDPAFLWRLLRGGRFTPELQADNVNVLQAAGELADVVVLATGPEGMRRYPELVRAAVGLVTRRHAPMCLGTTEHGAPLHPLARGAFAIPNDRQPVPFDVWDWKDALLHA